MEKNPPRVVFSLILQLLLNVILIRCLPPVLVTTDIGSELCNMTTFSNYISDISLFSDK